MTEERKKSIKSASKTILAGGGIIYGGMIPAFVWTTFEQKQDAQAAHVLFRDEQKELRKEYREEIDRIEKRIEARLTRIENGIIELTRNSK
jgi:hypothetical protein